jgi:catechol 2,3-dioxygenase-like lactoylglutathione lyase family enzyme
MPFPKKLPVKKAADTGLSHPDFSFALNLVVMKTKQTAVFRMLCLFSSIACTGMGTTVFSQTADSSKNKISMKLNAGIVTGKLAETKAFYTSHLGFGVRFENEFYLLLHTPGNGFELSFLLPNHPSQQPLFHKPFTGQGMYLTIEVEDVDKLYTELKKKAVAIKVAIRNEPWGDRHFAIEDPNGIAIDIVTYTPKQ